MGEWSKEWWSEAWYAVRDAFSDLPDFAQFAHVLVRLFVATVLGGLLGLERQEKRKPAGLRTHMLVALGTALVVVVSEQHGMASADLSRVVQGIVTGIGFVGAGAILKMTNEGQVFGLTTAASIWMAAAVGVAAGLGKGFTAVLGTVLALVILILFSKIERWLGIEEPQQREPQQRH